MAIHFRRELGLIVSWFVFPLVPVVLADFYYQTCNIDLWALNQGSDPREWSWFLWAVMLGPLLGYGFVAGATVDMPDGAEPQRHRWRKFFERRSVWVAVGPWLGFLVWMGLFFGYSLVANRAPILWSVFLPESVRGTWFESVLRWVYGTIIVVTLSYAWLLPAWAALRRAASGSGRNRAFFRGLSVALAFVGSLFGSFWAATSLWRSYFFDARIVPLIAIGFGLAVTSGCSDTVTYGEVRRRELFHAILVAWVLGLALMWRWWSRSRRGRPSDGAPT
jgi:MFS family permease